MKKKTKGIFYLLVLAILAYSFIPGNAIDTTYTGLVSSAAGDVATGLSAFDIGFLILKSGLTAFVFIKMFQYVAD